MSDTESDSGGSLAGWDAADFVEMSGELGHLREISQPVQAQDLCQVLKTLKDLDICVVQTDESSHEAIGRISSTILQYLNRVIEPVPSNHPDRAGMHDALQLLLTPSFLSLLFDYRALFRDIAARNADGPSASVIVCWVDVILAKLGQAIVVVAGAFFNVEQVDRHEPNAIRRQRENDMLRATVQLPERWSNLINVLGSEHASPAGTRLAFTLVFGASVVGPQIAGCSPAANDRVDWEAVRSALQLRLKRLAIKDKNPGHTHATRQEIVMHAMLVSLYASAEHSLQGVSPYRPQLQGVLADMIQAVLQMDLVSSSANVSSLTPVDTAVIILTRWGSTLPWAWVTWQDDRLYNSEVMEHLTATWLHSLHVPANEIILGHSVEYWDEELAAALETKPHAALFMMTRLLQCVLRTVERTTMTSCCAPTLDAVLKCCWSIKYLLQVTHIDHRSHASLHGVLCRLFTLLPDGVTELAIKDLLIEVLSAISIELESRGALDDIADPKSECSLAFDHKLLCALSLFESRRLGTHAELRALRQSIQFITIVCSSGTPPHFISDSFTHFLSSLVGWLKSTDIVSTPWTMLGDALVCLLTVFKTRQEDSAFCAPLRCWEDEFVWRLTNDADPTNLSLASSLAAYVCVTAHFRHCDRLIHGETWSYFRDTLLLILTSDCEGSDEPLALFVAPSICHALLALAIHSEPATLAYYMSSPWTVCLEAYLKNLRNSGDQFLRERIGLVAERLGKHLDRGALAVETGTHAARMSPVMESVFVWLHSLPCLVLSVIDA